MRPALLLALALAPPPAARPDRPQAVAVGPRGTVYMAEPGRAGVVRREPDGALSVADPGGDRDRTPLRAVRALAAAADGTVYAADSATGEVYRLRPGQAPAGLTGGAFEVPTGLALDAGGDLLVCDLRLGLLARVPRDGGRPVTVARVPAPRGVAVPRSGAAVVLSMGAAALVRVGADGRVVPVVAGRPFRFPTAVAADPEGDGTGVVVSDAGSAAVWSVSASGAVVARWQGAPLVRPAGLAFEPSGALLVADPGAGQVFRLARTGPAEPLLPARREGRR